MAEAPVETSYITYLQLFIHPLLTPDIFLEHHLTQATYREPDLAVYRPSFELLSINQPPFSPLGNHRPPGWSHRLHVDHSENPWYLIIMKNKEVLDDFNCFLCSLYGFVACI